MAKIIDRNIILHCAETITGGIATYLSELASYHYLSENTANLIYIVPESQVDSLNVDKGANIKTFGGNSGRLVRSFFLVFKTLILCFKHRPAVVHVHSTYAGFVIRPVLACLFPKTAIIYCSHGWAWDRFAGSKWRTRFLIKVELLLSNITDAIICISRYEMDSAIALGFNPDRLALIQNGISLHAPSVLETANSWPPGVKKVLFVGRFDEQKGVDTLVQAMNLLDGEAVALLAGHSVVDGSSSELVLPDNCISIGWKSPEELQALYRDADVLVMPSRWEGFGLVIAEAMRAKLAVVATKVGGIPELVENEKTGILVDKGDFEHIADVIKRFSSEDWVKMGEHGKSRFAKMFLIGRVHEQLFQVYRRVLESCSASTSPSRL